MFRVLREVFDGEARLSWVLAILAGLLGATAYMHSAGYFVTFMTGNAQRAVLGYFREDARLAISAGVLLVCFVSGVVVASWCRRRFWVAHPHGPTVLATISLVTATAVDIVIGGWSMSPVEFVPIMFVVFGVGALNTSFVKDGEVSIPLSYVTGTLVKMGQGIERHMSGGKAPDWLGYFLLLASYVFGATVGGLISTVVSGTQMLAVASLGCAVTTGYTYFHTDRLALMKAEAEREAGLSSAEDDSTNPPRPASHS